MTRGLRWIVPKLGTRTLQQTASVIFALISILPLLTFAYSLYNLNAIGKLEYQLGLGLALAVAVLGFAIFRVIFRRMSELIDSMAQVAGNREVSAAVRDGADLRVPGFGAIQEFSEMADLVHHLWKAEAELHVGERVEVSVKDAIAAVAGTLIRVSDDGVVLRESNQETGIRYRRILAIEPAGAAAAGPGRAAVPTDVLRRSASDRT
jgi:protein involved in polysaccharide export with SLBB domain